ncbi:kinase [Allostella sp. ATCC 35155]|nr:kinase [Stella sp. ATCC 35155]
MPDVDVLEVLLYGEPIATLTRVGGERILFAFHESYGANGARPVLSLGFKDRFGELITDFRPTRTRLLPFFSNLLPEGHMRSYLAGLAGVKPVREFSLLWALGMDLPGAVTVRSADTEGWLPGADDDALDDAHRRAHVLRFSLAGVQLKFSAVMETSGGLTIPTRGVGGSQIVKLPSAQFEGVPENEFSMMTLARLVGIDVPPVRLVDPDSIANLPEGIGRLRGPALAIERFDRLGDGTPVHIEDFAQVFSVYPESKYEKASYRGIASVIAAEGGTRDIAEFVRRLVFNTLIGNADMHLKNWSLIYPDRRTAALAPAYDLVSTIAYLADSNAALTFSRTKRFDGLTDDELAHLAAKARLPERLVLDTARETVSLFREHWHAQKAHLPLATAAIEILEAHMRTLPIAARR